MGTVSNFSENSCYYAAAQHYCILGIIQVSSDGNISKGMMSALLCVACVTRYYPTVGEIMNFSEHCRFTSPKHNWSSRNGCILANPAGAAVCVGEEGKTSENSAQMLDEETGLLFFSTKRPRRHVQTHTFMLICYTKDQEHTALQLANACKNNC